MIHCHKKQNLADEGNSFLQEVKKQNLVFKIQRKDNTDFQVAQAQLLKAQLFTFMK